MRRIIFFAILLVAGTGYCATHETRANKPPPDDRGTRVNPAIVEVVNVSPMKGVEVTKIPTIQVEQVEHLNLASAEWALVYLTALLATVTGILAIYTYRLFRATVALGDDAKKTTVAAVQSAQTAGVALIVSQRAYVFALRAKLANLDTNNAVEASLDIENSGNTPAIDVLVNTTISLKENPLKSPLIPIGKDEAKFTIGPKRTISTTEEGVVVEPEDLVALRNKSKALYVFGNITYTDVFGKECVTEFRFMCGGDVGGVNNDTIYIAEGGNTAQYDIKNR